MQGEYTDIELIYKVLHNSEADAFGTLMKRYSTQVYNAVIRIVLDEDKAADVTQLAFIQAYRQLNSWRGGNFGGWVTVIANHIAIRMLEKEKRRPTVPLEEDIEKPDETYDERKEKCIQTMETAIANLAAEDRQIITWHYYEKLTLKEISVRLKQTEGNIKMRIHRIREKLKTAIQNEENE